MCLHVYRQQNQTKIYQKVEPGHIICVIFKMEIQKLQEKLSCFQVNEVYRIETK